MEWLENGCWKHVDGVKGELGTEMLGLKEAKMQNGLRNWAGKVLRSETGMRIQSDAGEEGRTSTKRQGLG